MEHDAHFDEPLEERLWDHDPDVAPDPEDWLAMDATERQLAVAEAHEHALPDGHPIPGEGSWRSHAALHVVVENQLAAGDPAVTRATLERLSASGVARHDAVHAIASVIAEHLHAMLHASSEMDEAAFARDLRAIDPTVWRCGG